MERYEKLIIISNEHKKLKSTIDLDVFNSLVNRCKECSLNANDGEVSREFAWFIHSAIPPTESFIQYRCEHDFERDTPEYDLYESILVYGKFFRDTMNTE